MVYTSISPSSYVTYICDGLRLLRHPDHVQLRRAHVLQDAIELLAEGRPRRLQRGAAADGAQVLAQPEGALRPVPQWS